MVILFLNRFMEISGWIAWIIFILTIFFIWHEIKHSKDIPNEKTNKPFDPTKFYPTNAS
jgi:hypothetical protein